MSWKCWTPRILVVSTALVGFAQVESAFAKSRNQRSEMPVAFQELSHDVAALLGVLETPGDGPVCGESDQRVLERRGAEFRCLQSMCGGYFENRARAGDGVGDFQKRLKQAQKTLLASRYQGAFDELKRALGRRAEQVRAAIQGNSAAPTEGTEAFVAAYYLATTDCELFPCSSAVRKRSELYLKTKRDLDADWNRPYVEPTPQGFERAWEEFKDAHPEIAERVKPDWLEARSKAVANGTIAAWTWTEWKAIILELETLAHLAKTPALRRDLVSKLPTLKEAWNGQDLEYGKIFQSFEAYADRCLDNLAARMAMEPSPAEMNAFFRNEVPKARAAVVQLVQRNFSRESADKIEAALGKISIEPPDLVQTNLDHGRELTGLVANWTELIRRSNEKSWIESYALELPYTLLDHCRSLAGVIGNGATYDRRVPAIQLSSTSVKERRTDSLSHESMHGVDSVFLVHSAEKKASKPNPKKLLSEHSVGVKTEVDRCLARKRYESVGRLTTPSSVLGGPPLSESFADLGWLSSEGDSAGCALAFEKGRISRLHWRTREGHGSELFRIMHIRSYLPQPLPVACLELLELEGTPNLFEEKCVQR